MTVMSFASKGLQLTWMYDHERPLRLMAPPADVPLTDPAEQWIKYVESVVLVELRPKNVAGVKKLWDKVSKISGRNAKRQREEESKMNAHATGFVVKKDQSHTWVLTCAHIVSTLFDETNPISPNTIEELYDAWILCDHCEQSYLRSYPNLERQYTPATVMEVNCGMDLLLLRIAREDFEARCVHNHLEVPIARNFPAPLARTVLLSWPYLKERTVVSGNTVHPSRAYSCLSDDSSKGYQMRLSEVDVTSDFGSSGAPLIAGEHAVAVLQSGDTIFSYFISLDDLRATLEGWGMI